MENNINPEGVVWNSDEPATAGLTCDQLARALSGMISAFRAGIITQTLDGDLGLLKFYRSVLDAQIGLYEKADSLAPDVRDRIKKGFNGVLLSTGQAMVNSAGGADPEEFATVSVRAIEMLLELIDKHGVEKVDDCHLSYKVATDGETSGGNTRLKVGVSMIPMADLPGLIKDKLTQSPQVADPKIVKLFTSDGRN